MTEVEEPTFDLSIKKKKKVGKQAPQIQQIEEEQEVHVTQEEPTQEVVQSESFAAEDIDFGKKKRPKKLSKKTDGDQQQQQQDPANSLQDDEKDYTYEELAYRVFDLIHQSHPELLSSSKKKQAIPPPSVGRSGTKITLWTNFMETCEAMSRKPDHVLSFVLTELGTSGSIDGSARFVLKGRFQSKGIENVLRRYIVEYVACQTCNSPSTHLKKENRLQFLCCEKCSSKRSVTVIKKGFEAQIGKRSKTEAKQ